MNTGGGCKTRTIDDHFRMKTAQIGNAIVSRLLIGSNPFSGYSHQGVARDREMVRDYTVARIEGRSRDAQKRCRALRDSLQLRLSAARRDGGLISAISMSGREKITELISVEP